MLMLSGPRSRFRTLVAAFTLMTVLYPGAVSVQAQSRPAVPPRTATEAAATAAQTAVLRISCEGTSLNAEVSINGQFRGECPLDMKVAPGNIVITAVKKVDADRERVFEQRIRLTDGTIKRIDIELGAPQLTAEGQRAAQARQEQARLQEEARREQIRQRDEARQRAEAEARQRDADVLNALQQQATGGDAAAMVKVAEAYSEGKLVAKNEETALAWLSKAAQAGHIEAMYRLASRYEAGVGVKDEWAQAFNWYRKSAEAGHPGAIGGVAGFYYDGWIGTRDPDAALLWARKGAEAGNGRSMTVLANAMIDGGKGKPPNPPPPADMKPAMDLLERALALGEPRAADRLGALHYYGAPALGISKDTQKGMALWQKAAEAGIYGAPTASAAMRVIMFGPDARKARDWYQKASDSGSSEAMFYLGLFHLNGMGDTVKNPAVALPLFRRSAELGLSQAMLQVGLYYQHGLGGIPVSNEEAAAWYRKAEAEGNPHAPAYLKTLR